MSDLRCARCNREDRHFETIGTFLRFSDGGRAFVYRNFCGSCSLSAPTSIDVDLYGLVS